MPISAAIGIGSAILGGIADVGAAVGGAIAGGIADVGAGLVGADVAGGVAAADVAGGVAAADVAGGVAAADVAGATALPEILVTPAIAGGAEAAGAGALTGAEAAGAAGLVGGVTAIPETFGAGAAAAGGTLAATEALGGAAAPTAALSPTDLVGQDFGALTAAGVGPSVDISGVGTGLGAAADTALSFAPATTPIDPLSGVGGGGGGLAGDAFASAPAAVEGAVPGDIATALNTGQIGGLTSPTDIFSQATEPGTVGQLTGGTGIPTPAAMEVPGAPQIPPTISAPTSVASATPGASDINAIAASTGNLPAGTSLETASGVSPAASNLFSGSTLRTLGMLAPLGALGLTLARGQPGLPPAEEQALRNVQPGSPISNVANVNLNEAATGILQPGQVAQITQYTTNAKNQLYQLYARMGRDPTGDTDYISGLAQIDQNAQIMGQQFIDAAVKNGLAAQGIIDQTLQSAATMQVASDNAFQAALNSSLQSLGLVAALNAATARPA